MADQEVRNQNTVVVLGGGAIGIALVQQILSDTQTTSPIRCISTWHTDSPTWMHNNLDWYHLDATDAVAMQQFAQYLKKNTGNIDWVINTIGFLHEGTHSRLSDAIKVRHSSPEKRIADFDAEYFMRCMSINVTPSLLAAKYLSPLLKKKSPTIFAALSAKVGSIEDNRLGGWYSYRASKAALNMALKTLSLEWRRSLPECCVAALHPGTTASSLSAPFSANVPAEKLFSPTYTAECLLKNLKNMSSDCTGQFWSWDGSRIPW